jgi:alpha-ketoglutarate-dependent taurine dioxygenase
LGIYSTGHPLDPVKLINMIVKYNGIYEHIYELGDIIIWDNTQVMHQSTGYFKGRRSILRIQTDLMR